MRWRACTLYRSCGVTHGGPASSAKFLFFLGAATPLARMVALEYSPVSASSTSLLTRTATEPASSSSSA